MCQRKLFFAHLRPTVFSFHWDTSGDMEFPPSPPRYLSALSEEACSPFHAGAFPSSPEPSPPRAGFPPGQGLPLWQQDHTEHATYPGSNDASSHTHGTRPSVITTLQA